MLGRSSPWAEKPAQKLHLAQQAPLVEWPLFLWCAILSRPGVASSLGAALDKRARGLKGVSQPQLHCAAMLLGVFELPGQVVRKGQIARNAKARSSFQLNQKCARAFRFIAFSAENVAHFPENA
jgi:Ni/Fe-hydrogenase subunit HybB-like protein